MAVASAAKMVLLSGGLLDSWGHVVSPFWLHVREVCDADDVAAHQCISTLHMNSVNHLFKVYIHYFVATPETALFWLGNFKSVKFGVSRIVSHSLSCVEYFHMCPIRQLMIETDSPSFYFDHSLNPSQPSTTQFTYEVACWLACFRRSLLMSWLAGWPAFGRNLSSTCWSR